MSGRMNLFSATQRRRRANCKWRGTISGAKRGKNFFYCAPTSAVPLQFREGASRTPGGGTKMCSYSSLQHISRQFRRPVLCCVLMGCKAKDTALNKCFVFTQKNNLSVFLLSSKKLPELHLWVIIIPFPFLPTSYLFSCPGELISPSDPLRESSGVILLIPQETANHYNNNNNNNIFSSTWCLCGCLSGRP